MQPEVRRFAVIPLQPNQSQPIPKPMPLSRRDRQGAVALQEAYKVTVTLGLL